MAPAKGQFLMLLNVIHCELLNVRDVVFYILYIYSDAQNTPRPSWHSSQPGAERNKNWVPSISNWNLKRKGKLFYRSPTKQSRTKDDHTTDITTFIKINKKLFNSVFNSEKKVFNWHVMRFIFQKKTYQFFRNGKGFEHGEM